MHIGMEIKDLNLNVHMHTAEQKILYKSTKVKYYRKAGWNIFWKKIVKIQCSYKKDMVKVVKF